MRSRARRALPCWWLLTAGCVTGSYTRERIDEPIDGSQVAALQPGHDTLATCLLALGAPNRVFVHELMPDRSSGMALLWFWRDEAGWGLEVSAPLDDASVRVSYGATMASLPACMLWFLPDLTLERCRLGTVGELLPARARPALDEG